MKFKIAVFLLLLIFSGCKKESTRWDVDVNAPLFTTELSIGNLLSDSLITQNDEQYLSLILSEELFSLTTDSLTSIPDTLSYFSVPISGIGSIDRGTTFYYLDETKKMDFSPLAISKLILLSGNITIDIKNPFNQPIEITYQIPKALKNGTPFSYTITVPASSGNNNQPVFNKTIDVSGYEIDLRGASANRTNQLRTIISAKVSPTATGSANPISGASFLLQFMFKDPRFAYLKGFFGSTVTEYGPETANFDFFKNFISGNFSLEKCKASLEITNGIGADLQFRLLKLNGINHNTQNQMSFQSPVMYQDINISRAIETGAGIKPSIKNIDISESNILDLLGILPNQIEYAARIKLNPMGNISAGNDFAYHTQGLKAELKMEIPLSMQADNLTLQSLIDYSFSDELNVNNATLNLITENGFPFSAGVQLHLVDENNTTIRTLIGPGKTIASGIPVSEGVVEPVRNVITFKLDNNAVSDLKKGKKMRFTAVLNTSGSSYVKIYGHYRLKCKLTAKANYTMEIEH